MRKESLKNQKIAYQIWIWFVVVLSVRVLVDAFRNVLKYTVNKNIYRGYFGDYFASIAVKNFLFLLIFGIAFFSFLLRFYFNGNNTQKEIIKKDFRFSLFLFIVWLWAWMLSDFPSGFGTG